jgi:CopG family transcriptional regulator, nickel-responsive regulator
MLWPPPLGTRLPHWPRGQLVSAGLDYRALAARGSLRPMKDPLVRFGVAIERPLLRDLDALAEKRGCTRSELLRDLARAEIARASVPVGVDGVAALTLVYDHHVRDLSEKLTELQHQLGDDVRAALHVHLSHDLCLEVVVMQGKSDRLKLIADRMLAMRGVKHGGVEIIPGAPARGRPPSQEHGGQEQGRHEHDGQEHGGHALGGHEHGHGAGHSHAPAAPRRRTKARPR